MNNNMIYNGVTSIVTKVGNLIYKEVNYENLTNELILREIFWLTNLEKYNIAPKFIKRINNRIVMSYCGEPITSEEAKSSNVQRQLLLIMKILIENYCFYNDFKLDNTLILNNKVSIIDFGWCPLIKEDYSCNNLIVSDLKSKPSGNWFTLFNNL